MVSVGGAMGPGPGGDRPDFAVRTTRGEGIGAATIMALIAACKGRLFLVSTVLVAPSTARHAYPQLVTENVRFKPLKVIFSRENI